MNADFTTLLHPPRSVITRASLGLLAVVTIGPLLLEPDPVDFLPAYASSLATGLGIAGVLLLMAVALTVRGELDQASERCAAANSVLFAALAALLTFVHWIAVDRQPVLKQWQQDLYLGVLNHSVDAPHNYRPLPYGFARLVDASRVTGRSHA